MSCQLIDDLHPNRDASSLETMLKGKGPKGSETGEAPQKASKTCSLAFMASVVISTVNLLSGFDHD